MQDTLHRSEQLLFVPTAISFLQGKLLFFSKLVPWAPLQGFRPPRGRLRRRDLRDPEPPLDKATVLAKALVEILSIFGNNKSGILLIIRQIPCRDLLPGNVLSRSPVSEPCKTYICKAAQQKEQTFIEFQNSVTIYHKY